MTQQLYCVCLHSSISRLHDATIKVLAGSKDEARQIASTYQPKQFEITHVYTPDEFTMITGWPDELAKMYTPPKEKSDKMLPRIWRKCKGYLGRNH